MDALESLREESAAIEPLSLFPAIDDAADEDRRDDEALCQPLVSSDVFLENETALADANANANAIDYDYNCRNAFLDSQYENGSDSSIGSSLSSSPERFLNESTVNILSNQPRNLFHIFERLAV